MVSQKPFKKLVLGSYFPIDKLAKSLAFEARIWGFEALSEIQSEKFFTKNLHMLKIVHTFAI